MHTVCTAQGPALSTTSRHCRAVTGVTRYTSTPALVTIPYTLVIQAAAGWAGRVICQQLNGSYFREAFKLFEFDIQELEESLLLHGTDDDCDQLVAQLLVSLLQGCLPSFKKRINREVYIVFILEYSILSCAVVRQN